MNICLCCNSSYLKHLNTLIASILLNNESQNFNFYVINKDINIFNLQKSLQSSFEKNFEIFDCKTNQKIENFLDSLPHAKYGKESFYRLFLDEFIDKDKVLYLDCDMIVRGDLKRLWEINIKENIIGAVSDSIDGSFLGMPKEKKYFNSGLLLIDIKKWKKNQLQKKTINFICSNFNELIYPDQDALNYCLMNKWLELDSSYNYQLNNPRNQYRLATFTNNQYPTIVHFNGDSLNKPWLINSEVKFKWSYWQYRNKTFYKSLFADDYSFQKFLGKSFRVFYKILFKIPFQKFLNLDYLYHHLNSINKELEKLNLDLSDSNEALNSINKELDKSNTELNKANQILNSINKELDKSNTELNKANQILNSINKELDKSNTELNKANQNLNLINKELVKKNFDLRKKSEKE